MALTITGIGIFLIDYFPDGKTGQLSQISLRLGFVLGAIWLAFPQVAYLVQHVSPNILALALLVIVLFLKRPYILIPCLIVCVLLGIMQYAIRVFNSR